MFLKQLMLAYESLINQSRLFGCVGMVYGNFSGLDQYRGVSKGFYNMWDLLLNSKDNMFRKIQTWLFH